MYWARDILKAKELIKENQFDQAQALLAPLKDSENADCSIDATRLLAQIALTKNDFSSARELFESVAKKTQNTQDILKIFEIGKILKNAALLTSTLKWLEEVNLKDVEKEKRAFSQVSVCFFYLEAMKELKLDLGFSAIADKAFAVYKEQPTLDSHFLYSRGIPFFNNFLKLLKEASQAIHCEPQFHAKLDEVLKWAGAEAKADIQNLRS